MKKECNIKKRHNYYYRLKTDKICVNCNKPNYYGMIDQYKDFYCIDCLVMFYDEVNRTELPYSTFTVDKKIIKEMMHDGNNHKQKPRDQ